MFNFLRHAVSGIVSSGEPLAVGATAPGVPGVNQDGRTVDLGALYHNGYVLVFFYPMAGTPGCTAEACSLRDAFADLHNLGLLTIIGVSHDCIEDQKKFAVKQGLPFDLIADPKSEIYNAFGVAGLRRQSFLMKDGVVIWRDLHASTDQQADDVKKALLEDQAKSAKSAGSQ